MFQSIAMPGKHTHTHTTRTQREREREAVLNKLSKPELVQVLLNTDANIGPRIATLTAENKKTDSHLNKLEPNVAVIKNVNSRLVVQLLKLRNSAGRISSTLDVNAWR